MWRGWTQAEGSRQRRDMGPPAFQTLELTRCVTGLCDGAAQPAASGHTWQGWAGGPDCPQGDLQALAWLRRRGPGPGAGWTTGGLGPTPNQKSLLGTWPWSNWGPGGWRGGREGLANGASADAHVLSFDTALRRRAWERPVHSARFPLGCDYNVFVTLPSGSRGFLVSPHTPRLHHSRVLSS